MKKFITVFLLLFSIHLNAQVLWNMFFLSEDIGWIQTKNPLNYTPNNSFWTTDGGITWWQVSEDLNYIEISFINDSVGFLLSFDKHNLYKTDDKGETWQLVKDSLINLTGIQFADENVGYSNSHADGLLKTTDGGITWNAVGGIAYDFDVVTKDKVINIEHEKTYLITTDGGISWQTEFFPFPNTAHEMNLSYIQFTDTLNGFVCTNTINPQMTNYSGIYRTKDGGKNWEYIRTYRDGRTSMKDSLIGIQHGSGYYLTYDGFETFINRPTPDIKVWDYFFYSCEAFYVCGSSGYFAKAINCGDTWNVLPFNPVVLVEVNENESPKEFSLEQNYPNPFNPVTSISYTIPGNEHVSLRIYDILGNEIALLINEEKPAGEYQVEWSASSFSSGVYFYRLTSGEFSSTKKLLLMK